MWSPKFLLCFLGHLTHPYQVFILFYPYYLPCFRVSYASPDPSLQYSFLTERLYYPLSYIYPFLFKHLYHHPSTSFWTVIKETLSTVFQKMILVSFVVRPISNLFSLSYIFDKKCHSVDCCVYFILPIPPSQSLVLVVTNQNTQSPVPGWFGKD